MGDEEAHTAGSLNASINAGANIAGLEELEGMAVQGPAGNQAGGMQVFGIGKDGISRAIVKFQSPPKPQPYTVCMQFPGVFLSHKYVIAMFKSILIGLEEASVVSVQFVDRNVGLGTRNLDNRWLVTVSSMAAREKLINTGITIVNKKIQIRPYDDVLAEEYVDFQQYIQHQRRMGLKTQEIQEDAEAAEAADEENETQEKGEHRDSDDSVDYDTLHPNLND